VCDVARLQSGLSFSGVVTGVGVGAVAVDKVVVVVVIGGEGRGRDRCTVMCNQLKS
jgi:hypothetical protein